MVALFNASSCDFVKSLDITGHWQKRKLVSLVSLQKKVTKLQPLHQNNESGHLSQLVSHMSHQGPTSFENLDSQKEAEDWVAAWHSPHPSGNTGPIVSPNPVGPNQGQRQPQQPQGCAARAVPPPMTHCPLPTGLAASPCNWTRDQWSQFSMQQDIFGGV